VNGLGRGVKFLWNFRVQDGEANIERPDPRSVGRMAIDFTRGGKNCGQMAMDARIFADEPIVRV
tara:strand:+ start:277 stop:468 length:192 start_codon:yes stop_codon:yes gene_type:complete